MNSNKNLYTLAVDENNKLKALRMAQDAASLVVASLQLDDSKRFIHSLQEYKKLWDEGGSEWKCVDTKIPFVNGKYAGNIWIAMWHEDAFECFKEVVNNKQNMSLVRWMEDSYKEDISMWDRKENMSFGNLQKKIAVYSFWDAITQERTDKTKKWIDEISKEWSYVFNWQDERDQKERVNKIAFLLSFVRGIKFVEPRLPKKSDFLISLYESGLVGLNDVRDLMIHKKEGNWVNLMGDDNPLVRSLAFMNSDTLREVEDLELKKGIIVQESKKTKSL